MHSRAKWWAGNWTRTLAARLPIAALEKAIAERKPPPGLVHHSDRGIQYACGEYVDILRKHDMIPSMSRPANPYDNASCESFMKTLKREEINADEYRDLDHLRENIATFIDHYYNRVRLHSALGYRPPEEFEQAAEPWDVVFARSDHEFFQASGDLSIRCRHQMQEGSRPKPAPRTIVSMSLRPAIPRRVALQQSPPPLRRPRTIVAQKSV